MSTSQNVPPTSQQATTPSYTYSTYHPPTGAYGHPQTAAAYSNPYQAASYPTGVTGYGAWPYQYSYVPQQHPQSTLQSLRPSTVLPATATTFTPTFSPSLPPRSTFTPYTPTYSRDVVTTPTAPATGRGSRKQQSNFKGLFSKERAFTTMNVVVR